MKIYVEVDANFHFFFNPSARLIEKGPRNPLFRRLNDHQSRYVWYWEKKILDST